MIGETIAHYHVIEKIGAGGMGVVFKARDAHLDRFIALKVLPAEKVADPDRKRRFVQEAKAASALNHPKSLPYMTSLNPVACSSLPWNTSKARHWSDSLNESVCICQKH